MASRLTGCLEGAGGHRVYPRILGNTYPPNDPVFKNPFPMALQPKHLLKEATYYSFQNKNVDLESCRLAQYGINIST